MQEATARSELISIDADMVLVDGFDFALIGWTFVGPHMRPVYDAYACIRHYIDDGGMTLEQAHTHFERNVLKQYPDVVFVFRLHR